MSDNPAHDLQLVRCRDERELAERSAGFLAERIDGAVRARGRAAVALSGGSTPLPMFRALAAHTLEWHRTHIFQVDERIAPPGDPARNLTALEQILGRTGATLHAVPVDLPAPQAAEQYRVILREIVGPAPVFDAIHLGLGADGHTASLFPDDPALNAQADVAHTLSHAGWARVTLTMPVLNRADAILWIVSGASKQNALAKLISQDRSIPAASVQRGRAVVFADAFPAGKQR